MDQYIIESEATVVEVDGERRTIVLLAFDYGSPEAKHLVSDEVWRLLEKHKGLMIGMRHADGTLGFMASAEYQEKLRAAIGPDHKWRRVRLYPPSDELLEFAKRW